MAEHIVLDMHEGLPLRDDVYRTLRREILEGRIRPGERLVELSLSQTLGVSRTPVREALHMLEQDGLVVTIPRRGAVVAQITEKDVEEVLEIRTALEVLVITKACDAIDDEGLRRLEQAEIRFEQCCRSGSLEDRARADVAFHEILIEAADNRRLSQILGYLAEQIYRYRMESLKDKTAFPVLISQHRDMCDALRRRDADEAVRLVREHIEGQRRMILEKLAP